MNLMIVDDEVVAIQGLVDDVLGIGRILRKYSRRTAMHRL